MVAGSGGKVYVDVAYVSNGEPLEVSVRAMAEILDVSPSTLRRLINGQSGVGPAIVIIP